MKWDPCTDLVLSTARSQQIHGGEGKTSKEKENIRKWLLLPKKAFAELQIFGFPIPSTNK